jgi:NAD(P)H-hydrate epimerase
MNYKKLLPKRQQKSHKGSFGKVLNIAGSQNLQGAAFLSSISALKIGAGYVVLACPEKIIGNIASLTPDLTFLPLTDSPLKNIIFKTIIMVLFV